VLPSAPPPDVVVQCQWPVRESNPPRRLERAASCTDRRTGRVVCCCSRGELCAHRVRRVGREALESSSAVLQTAAKPSQLPARTWSRVRRRRASQQKRPGVFDAGPCGSLKRVRPSVTRTFHCSRARNSPAGRYSPTGARAVRWTACLDQAAPTSSRRYPRGARPPGTRSRRRARRI
jgi:hypothetical protein